MSSCIQQYPDTNLTDADRATVARILARPAHPLCVAYARILSQWSKAAPADQLVWQQKAQVHIQVCGCRVQKPADSSWIFEGVEEQTE
jgi:hypothetical protein